MKRPLALLLLAFLATSLVATGYALATTPSLTNGFFSINSDNDRNSYVSSNQGIAGSITIANISPLCSPTGSVPATGPDLLITSSNGKTQTVALGWTIQNRCVLASSFQVALNPGAYSLSLSNCGYFGCKSLPITVIVEPGVFSPLKLGVTTGIY